MGKETPFVASLRKLAGAFTKLESFIAILGAAVLIVAVLIAVVCRYWLYIATPWADELSRYVFLWIAFVGMGYITQYNMHIDVQLIDTIVKKRAADPQKVLAVFIRLAQVLSLAVLIISTVLYGKFLFARFPAFSPSLHIPMRIPYLSTFAGLLLMDLHELALLFLPTVDPMGTEEH